MAVPGESGALPFDQALVGKRLEVCWPYKEAGKTTKIWASGVVKRIAERYQTNYMAIVSGTFTPDKDTCIANIVAKEGPLPVGAHTWEVAVDGKLVDGTLTVGLLVRPPLPSPACASLPSAACARTSDSSTRERYEYLPIPGRHVAHHLLHRASPQDHKGEERRWHLSAQPPPHHRHRGLTVRWPRCCRRLVTGQRPPR